MLLARCSMLQTMAPALAPDAPLQVVEKDLLIAEKVGKEGRWLVPPPLCLEASLPCATSPINHCPCR